MCLKAIVLLYEKMTYQTKGTIIPSCNYVINIAIVRELISTRPPSANINKFATNKFSHFL